MTRTVSPIRRSSTRPPGQSDIERIADAVVRTPTLEPSVISFLARRVADHWSIDADEVDRRLAVSVAREVSVRDTRRLLRSA